MVKNCWPPSATKKRLQRNCYWISAEENIPCSVSRKMIVIALFTCLCFNDKLGLCSINYHTHKMTGNCSVRLRVLAYKIHLYSTVVYASEHMAPSLTLNVLIYSTPESAVI